MPCGKCGVCRTNMVNTWIPRFMAECKTSDFQLFLTLTYDDEHLRFSQNGIPSVDKRDCQLFFKSVRADLGKDTIRYYLCGEYGGRTLRPHYHVLLFGSGCDQSHCVDTIVKHWYHGHVHCGSVGPASIRYCANFHIHKCATPDGAEPSFTLYSRRPGIGGLYFDRRLQQGLPTNRKSFVFAGQEYKWSRYWKDRYVRSTGDISDKKPVGYDHLSVQESRFRKSFPTDTEVRAAKVHESARFNYLQKKHNKL